MGRRAGGVGGAPRASCARTESRGSVKRCDFGLAVDYREAAEIRAKIVDEVGKKLYFLWK